MAFLVNQVSTLEVHISGIPMARLDDARDKTDMSESHTLEIKPISWMVPSVRKHKQTKIAEWSKNAKTCNAIDKS